MCGRGSNRVILFPLSFSIASWTPLLADLNTLRVGFPLQGQEIGSIAFTDDVLLLSASLEGSRVQLEDLHQVYDPLFTSASKDVSTSFETDARIEAAVELFTADEISVALKSQR